MPTDTDWIFPSEIEIPVDATFDPIACGYAGFVYEIVQLRDKDGKIVSPDEAVRYVGRKYFSSTTKPPVRKKATSSRRKRVTKESSWRSYWGSSKPFTEFVKTIGRQNFERKILILCETKSATNFEETRAQFALDVLNARTPSGRRRYANKNILGRFYGNGSAIPANIAGVDSIRL